MKKQALNRIFATAAAALVASGLLTPLDVHARGRSTTVHGPRGGTYQRQINHGPGSLSASGTATLPKGKTASRSLTSQQTTTGRSTSARVTGFEGRTATYDAATTRTDTGYTRQVNVAGPNGATGTKQVNVSNEGGRVTRTVTTTATPPTP